MVLHVIDCIVLPRIQEIAVVMDLVVAMIHAPVIPESTEIQLGRRPTALLEHAQSNNFTKL